jgi:hypothetical protein
MMRIDAPPVSPRIRDLATESSWSRVRLEIMLEVCPACLELEQ